MNIFRFVVPPTGSTRLDLNAPTGWQVSRGFDLGKAESERTYIKQPPYDGATLVSASRGIVTMSVPLLLRPVPPLGETDAQAAAAMKTLMDALFTELNRMTNCIEMRLTGASSSYYIDTFKADLPSLYQGTGAPNPILLRQGGGPMILSIDRQPTLRGAGSHI